MNHRMPALEQVAARLVPGVLATLPGPRICDELGSDIAGLQRH